MRFPVLLAVPLLILSGCSSKESASTSTPSSTGPLPTPYITAPSTKDEKPTAGTPTAPTTPKRAAAEDKPGDGDLEDYSRKLAVIMGAKEVADRQWNEAMRKSATKIGKSLQAVRQPFERYSAAIEKTSEALQNLRPPKAAEAFHAVLFTAIDRLDENLQLTVEAIKSNEDAEAARLSDERKDLFKEGAEAGIATLEKSGFDVRRYLSEHRLVRKEGSTQSTPAGKSQ